MPTKPHGSKPTCYDRLKDILMPVLGEGGFSQWLHAKNRALDNGKPIDLIIDGKCDDAITLAQQHAASKRE